MQEGASDGSLGVLPLYCIFLQLRYFGGIVRELCGRVR